MRRIQAYGRQRSYSLDFIKILATTAVVFHHYQLVSGVRFDHHINFYGDRIFQWGRVVDLFFMISGFLAFGLDGLHTEQISFAKYIGKKLNRLLPVAACSSVLYAGLSYCFYQINKTVFWTDALPDLWDLLVACLGLSSGFGLDQISINNPLWFISSLILCYCLYYYLSFVNRKRKWRMEWILLAVVFLMLNMLQSGTQVLCLNGDTQRGFLFFSVGLLLKSFLTRYELSRGFVTLSIGAVLLFLGFVAFAPAYIDVMIAFSLLFCPALLILSQTGTAKKLFCHAIWKTVSEISYNVYVWHFTIQLLCTLLWPEWMHSGRVEDMYLFGVLTWLIGTLSHFGLEKPLNKWVPALWRMFFYPKQNKEAVVGQEFR